MYDKTLENFITFCDEMQIAEEMTLRNAVIAGVSATAALAIGGRLLFKKMKKMGTPIEDSSPETNVGYIADTKKYNGSYPLGGSKLTTDTKALFNNICILSPMCYPGKDALIINTDANELLKTKLYLYQVEKQENSSDAMITSVDYGTVKYFLDKYKVPVEYIRCNPRERIAIFNKAVSIWMKKAKDTGIADAVVPNIPQDDEYFEAAYNEFIYGFKNRVCIVCGNINDYNPSDDDTKTCEWYDAMDECDNVVTNAIKGSMIDSNDDILQELILVGEKCYEGSLLLFGDNFTIAMEAGMSNSQYTLMRNMQTNTLGLKNQLFSQKSQCKKRLAACHADDEYDDFRDWLNKQKRGVQRKINGKEIPNKAMLQKFIALYDEYLAKCNNH